MSEQSEIKPERRKPTYRHDPKRPIYNFPVHLLWGDSLMEAFQTEEERVPIASAALDEAANAGTGFALQFHFFEFEGVRYLMESFGYPHEFTIFCDLDVKIPRPKDGEDIEREDVLEHPEATQSSGSGPPHTETPKADRPEPNGLPT